MESGLCLARLGLGQWSDWSREEVTARLLGYTDIEEQEEIQTFQVIRNQFHMLFYAKAFFLNPGIG